MLGPAAQAGDSEMGRTGYERRRIECLAYPAIHLDRSPVNFLLCSAFSINGSLLLLEPTRRDNRV